jgi:hypothetical protein
MANHLGESPFEGFNDPSKPDFQKRRELMRDLLNTASFRGALGEHVEQKSSPEDEGAIQFAIGEANGKVVIDFGTPVHWLGMTPQQAADFASAVLKRARQVGRKRGETVTMMIG